MVERPVYDEGNRCEVNAPVELTEGKCQFDRHENGNGLSEPRSRGEAPLFGSFDGFLIQSEG
jgi:hypothetical protein